MDRKIKATSPYLNKPCRTLEQFEADMKKKKIAANKQRR